jgi:SAM-dependent methyltransferase
MPKLPESDVKSRKNLGESESMPKDRSQNSKLQMHDSDASNTDPAEPDWDQRYLTGDTPWEKGYASPPLSEFLESDTFAGSVLVPGCGHGHDVRLLARFGARPLGLDVAPAAVNKARAFQRSGNESYRLGDLFKLDKDLCGAFDGIFEHTCFCAIHPSRRIDYVRSVSSALKSRGHLLAVFFIKIEDPEGPPFPVSSAEIDDLFHPYFETRQRWVPTAAYPGREGREEMRLMRKTD